MTDQPSEKEFDMKQVKAELVGRFATGDLGLKRREVSVMCRLSAKTVAIMDALVELEIFKSKSEAIATFLQQVIAEREEMFDEILAQANAIASKREAAKHLAFQAVMSGGKKEKKD